ncbi:MAG TPA: CaiB/BaiF CoA-transferase family protein [Bordetella sp.]
MGPLAGVKVLEMEALGPVPWAAMMLSDMGADVLRIDRPDGGRPDPLGPRSGQVMLRGRRSLVLDLKQPGGGEAVLELAARADILLEGLRPGVMERLGIGPEICLARNPALVYGRMTGWGQHGPLAQQAGHDINYIAAAGVLHTIGPHDGPPAVPLNLIGDLGGGGMLLALGVVSALLHARACGEGQVVDAAMIDGCNALMASVWGRFAAGAWCDERERNVLDGGAPFYSVYEAADGKWLAFGAIEPHFYQALLDGLGLSGETLPAQHDRTAWPDMRRRIAGIVRQRSRDDWCAIFAGSDACVTPVLSLAEARESAHQRARDAFVAIEGVMHPAPAPRFSRSAGAIVRPPCARGAGGAEALRDWGLDPSHPALRQVWNQPPSGRES